MTSISKDIQTKFAEGSIVLQYSSLDAELFFLLSCHRPALYEPSMLEQW